ncbi:MAG: hypothetical protein HKL90_11320, partial [Elusimicrobia bacterium]|nr:hypothetical protein [Elusimicrobiota bacterium]
MNRDNRRVLVPMLVLLVTAWGPAFAAVVDVDVPRVPFSVGLAAVMGAAPSVTAPSLTSAPAGLAAAPALAPSFSAAAAAPALAAVPSAAAVAPAAAAAPAAGSAAAAPAFAAAAPAPAAEASARSVAPAADAPALEALRDSAAARDRDGRRAFDGGAAAAPVSAERGPVAGFVKNDEGVWVGGRTADQYREIRRLYAKLSPLMDLSDTMNVMDDAFSEARVKLAAVEKAAADRKVAESSVHLEETRTFVDAVLEDANGRKIAEHTHRVYFHPADNADSEINEGIRRVDGYLEEAKQDFARGGRAEREMGTEFDQVLLTFDTRGYKEIADHLRGKEAELRAQFG